MTLRATGILASAGSGKTYSLTTEYLRLLLRGVETRSILVATFTRAAAGEILSRVFGRLCDAANSQEKCDELRAACECGGDDVAVPREPITRDRCRHVAAELARGIDGVGIFTFDAWMGRLASAIGAEAGLPGEPRLLSEDEDRALRERSMAAALEASRSASLLTLLRMLGSREAFRSVEATTHAVIGDVYAAHRQSAAGAWNVVMPESALMTGEEIDARLASFAACAMPTGKDGTKPLEQWRKAHEAAVRMIRAGAWEDLLSKGIACKVAAGERTFSQREISERIADAYRPFVDHAAATLIGRLSERNAAARVLLDLFDGEYRRLKFERGAILFEDVPEALSRGVSERTLVDLYDRLDARYEHVLLDEFQDTSIPQFRVIEPMLAEIVSDETRDRTMFYVGDAKQSLYGWRDAEPALLGHLAERWPQIRTRDLSTSRRSSPIVIEAVNRLFSGIAGNAALTDDASAREAALNWAKRFRRHESDASVADLPGLARLSTYPNLTASDGEEPRGDTDRDGFIARRVARIVEACPSASVGVLVRRKEPVQGILAALHEVGIEASELGGSRITRSPAVASVVSLVTLAERPRDTMSAYHVACTPLGHQVGLDRDLHPDRVSAVAGEIRDRLTRHGYAALARACREWLAPVCSEIDRERMDRLIELATTFDARADLKPGAFAAAVENHRASAASDSRVRVMTVHQSKGLEFDAVLLPELDVKIPIVAPNVVWERTDLLGAITGLSLYGKQELQSLSPVLFRLATQTRVRQFEEALCVLYVGVTRARRMLELIVGPGKVRGGVTMGAIARAAFDVPEIAPPDATLWRHGDDRWHEGVDAERAGEGAKGSRGKRRAVVEVAAGLHAEVSADRASVAPSRIGKSAPAGSIAALPRRLAIGLGVGMHACFECVEWLEDGEPTDERLLLALSRSDLPFELDHARVIERFRAALSMRGVAEVLRRSRYEALGVRRDDLRIYRELPLHGAESEARRHATRDGSDPAIDAEGIEAADAIDGDDDPISLSPRAVRARADRVVVTRRDGQAIAAEIVDWKTDAAGSAEDARRLAQRYVPQMDAYRSLIGGWLGLDVARVTAALVFTSVGAVVPTGS